MKYFLIVLTAIAVFGFVMFLTMIQPGRMSYEEYNDVETVENTAAMLREAEGIEAEFVKKLGLGNVSDKDIEALRKSIKLRETYMSITGSVDRLQNNRLVKAQAMLQNIDAKPLSEKVDSLESKADTLEKTDSVSALKLYNDAYELQNKINSEYPLSEFKNIQRIASLERKMRIIAAKPLYLESVNYERRAYEALKGKKWSEAQSNFVLAIEKFVKLSIEYPNTSYVDFARLKKLEGDLDSLRSMPLEETLDKHIAFAAAAEKNGDYMQAAEAYVAAAQEQRKLNTLYPKSRRASDDAVKEYMRQRDRVFSSRFGMEILNQKHLLDKMLYEGNYRDVAEISSNLIRKVEKFKNDYKDSSMLSENLALELRYINYMVREIPSVLEYVNKNSLPLDGFKNTRMFKTEIPQDIYFKIMQDNPSRVRADKLPVDSVIYDDAEKFCQRLGWLLGRKISMPSLEQYKAALGSMKYVDLNAISWNFSNSDAKTHDVATKQANAKGFFDLLGNVSEIASSEDAAHNTEFFAVGGNSQSQTDSLMEFPVLKIAKNARSRMTGFRIVVADIPPKNPADNADSAK